MAYASGKFAYGLCDRCGFKYKYKVGNLEHLILKSPGY